MAPFKRLILVHGKLLLAVVVVDEAGDHLGHRHGAGLRHAVVEQNVRSPGQVMRLLTQLQLYLPRLLSAAY